MKIHYTHTNFRVPPSQKLNRPNGFSTRKKHYLIFFHFHSSAILNLNGREYKTSPHACVFVGAKTPHAMQVENTILHDWIIFDGEKDFMPLLENLGLTLDTVYYPESFEKVTDLISQIEHHYFENDEFFQIYFEAKMRDLLLLLAREKKHLQISEEGYAHMPNDLHLYALHRDLMRISNLTGYSEKYIIKQAKCSRSTLFRHYRRLFGCSPYEDLQRACLKRGERYLVESDFTVEEIAELLGYKSVNVFIRRFKWQNGLTPNEWRKQEREKIKNEKEIKH